VIDLAFSVSDARVDRYAAAPQIDLRLHVTERTGAKVDAIALRTQVRIDVQRRRYSPAESAMLAELFGTPERYADTLKPITWTHIAQTVVAFSGDTAVDLHVPCSYDFEVAAHKYLASLDDGVIPLNLLFSGMVFVQSGNGIAAEFVPWSCEARFGLPVAQWRAAMDAFFPNAAWIRVNRELFDELRLFKNANGLPTWDAALARLCELAKAAS
jgi:hypothetical protein